MQASHADDMNDFLKIFNSSSNTTSADIYKSQKAGHMTGGGLVIRNQVINTKPISVTLPKVDAGCGGIDIYTGAFSYINSDELVNTLKSIASNAKGYAFYLALETVSPQIANNLRSLQDLSNKINSQNINSCELASQMVGSLWPRDSMASEHICRTVNSQNGYFADWAASKHQCSKPDSSSEGDKVQNQAASSIGLLGEEYNLAWEALKKQSFFSQNPERAAYFMSLMGTTIKRVKEDGGNDTAYFPSKIFDESFLRAILEGGEATIYKCNENLQCLKPTESKITISSQASWKGFVRGKLLSIQSKVLRDQELDSDEINFIGSTRFPLYRIINVITASSRNNSPVMLYEISDVIAFDMFLQYLREAIEVTRQGLEQLRITEWFDKCEIYAQHLGEVEGKVLYYENRCSDQLEKKLQIDQLIRILEEEQSQKLKIAS